MKWWVRTFTLNKNVNFFKLMILYRFFLFFCHLFDIMLNFSEFSWGLSCLGTWCNDQLMLLFIIFFKLNVFQKKVFSKYCQWKHYRYFKEFDSAYFVIDYIMMQIFTSWAYSSFSSLLHSSTTNLGLTSNEPFQIIFYCDYEYPDWKEISGLVL